MSKKSGDFDTMAGRVETGDTSKLPGEGLVRQRLLQRLQRGELPLGEVGEALGCGFVHAGRASSGTAVFSYSTTPTRRMWSSRAGWLNDDIRERSIW